MKNKRFRLLGLLGLVLVGISSFLFQSPIQAKEDKNVQVKTTSQSLSGRIFYDTDNLYTMRGTKNGAAWTDTTASLAVHYPDGRNEMVFCIQPGVPLVGGKWTDGYEGVESTEVDGDALIASCIWQTVFPNKTQHEEMASRAVTWQYIKKYNLDITSVDGIPEYPQLEKKLMDAVENYKKLPDFHNKTVKLKYGETKKLSSGGVDLRAFDSIISNDANVKFEIASDGMSANATPTDPTKATGTYTAIKNYAYGTPIVWTKENSQTVVSPKIADPTKYFVNWDIDLFGEIEIGKVDKDSGAYLPNTSFDAEFEGTNAPAKKSVKTGSNGKVTIKDVPSGVKYKITETSVPSPYVLASAIGESDTYEGVVKAGETATVTAKNVKATGQIIIEKSGVESGKEPWNSNYSRAGNVFEIREKDKEGKVVETITSNEQGIATSSNKLPLGTYYVSEKTAANGFANTFKPVTVKIEYKDQKTPVVVVNDKGTNQEVTGSSVLTKEDAETKKDTQGRASFEGAEYGLFYKDGKPVKWTDRVKPELTNGTLVKTEDDSVVIRIDDKDQTAGVKHLALNGYYWLEVKAPEGYQLDSTKREFELKYKDQGTKVVTSDVTSQEKVIKLTIDGFKYLQSKGGNVNSGYNGIKFSLTPIDPTKGEPVEVETQTDTNGYDGYWAFKDFPYGDYRISEVAAPEGYKKMKDLILKSSFDAEKRTYNMTVTEEGQKEPIKTLTVEESKINEGSNQISLGKLMITNNLVKAPKISTKASVDGKKTFTPGKETPMKDTVSLTDITKDQKYRLKGIQLWRVQDKDYKNATVVYETDQDFTADAENMEKVVETLVDTSKDDEKTAYVWTEKLAELDKDDKEKEVADHMDLTNEEQTVRPEMPKEEPKIETLFTTVDGKQEIDATKDQKLVDKVNQEFPESQVGQTKYWVHKLHKVTNVDKTVPTSSKASATSKAATSTTSTSSTTSSSQPATESATTKGAKSEVLETISDSRKVTKGNEEFNVDFQYYAKKYNLKEGEKLVVTHEIFNDEKHTDKYADHFDLNNEKQTIRPLKVEPKKETPKKETPATPKAEKSIPQTGSYNAFEEFFSAIFN
ncbi:SpaA isopeptide-forming pilin-related protein [Enterococcus avium]|uniref:SpaA isopeptide-forming pilin-related protein n=1 Tax=Enterococcus avium TaxID=33945 RepID=A0AAW8RTW4_ENTAV|nr:MULTISPECIES: SpaA isopeptide-forming pilin-related protein [Enterococcus]MDT2401786.1 SpaA isopeptide-forming pilin-related protein [Enterococcus avium]MDT2434228.1 SpaA isopeptide-forming pilin-related protein [Enterococcus avium]MDT2466126.1 SpaA isopeptide-forming pilin-related protein [Enterococcus avium]MDT2484073.1 SpaA isopeptide-forming pilin-related protein [Enterococcus avium]MDT2505552.1 SpaA isopeptide-forming pilin-related protein [Enterococcus avium]